MRPTVSKPGVEVFNGRRHLRDRATVAAIDSSPCADAELFVDLYGEPPATAGRSMVSISADIEVGRSLRDERYLFVPKEGHDRTLGWKSRTCRCSESLDVPPVSTNDVDRGSVGFGKYDRDA